jgi:hypothetical protein
MTLINLEGLALIGPGSEWFWSMLQFVIVAITLYAIYRQVRLQGSSSAIEQVAALERDWTAEAMTRSRLAVLNSLRDGEDSKAVPGQAGGLIGNFRERVGYLVKAGHIRPELVWEYSATRFETWWAWLTPFAEESRRRFEVTQIFENFEWLAGQMAEMDRRAGQSVSFDEAYLARQLRPFIESNLDALRTAEELRAVIVRPQSPAVLNSEAPRH